MILEPPANIRASNALFFNGTAGHAAPGTPALHFSLSVNGITKEITGIAEIDWGSEGGARRIKIPQVRGRIYWKGLGRYTTVFGFDGIYLRTPHSGVTRDASEQLTASFAIDNQGRGIGIFRSGPQSSGKVPIAVRILQT